MMPVARLELLHCGRVAGGAGESGTWNLVPHRACSGSRRYGDSQGRPHHDDIHEIPSLTVRSAARREPRLVGGGHLSASAGDRDSGNRRSGGAGAEPAVTK